MADHSVSGYDKMTVARKNWTQGYAKNFRQLQLMITLFLLAAAFFLLAAGLLKAAAE